MLEHREFIVGPYLGDFQDVFKINLYGVSWRNSKARAQDVGRELAEGPTQVIYNNYYGPVELWPLVYQGE